jgi:hypothetical protein
VPQRFANFGIGTLVLGWNNAEIAMTHRSVCPGAFAVMFAAMATGAGTGIEVAVRASAASSWPAPRYKARL